MDLSELEELLQGQIEDSVVMPEMSVADLDVSFGNEERRDVPCNLYGSDQEIKEDENSSCDEIEEDFLSCQQPVILAGWDAVRMGNHYDAFSDVFVGDEKNIDERCSFAWKVRQRFFLVASSTPRTARTDILNYCDDMTINWKDGILTYIVSSFIGAIKSDNDAVTVAVLLVREVLERYDVNSSCDGVKVVARLDSSDMQYVMTIVYSLGRDRDISRAVFSARKSPPRDDSKCYRSERFVLERLNNGEFLPRTLETEDQLRGKRYRMSPKEDGVQVAIVGMQGKVRLYTRSYSFKDYECKSGDFVLLGEKMGDHIVVFDVLDYNGRSQVTEHLDTRLMICSNVIEKLDCESVTISIQNVFGGKGINPDGYILTRTDTLEYFKYKPYLTVDFEVCSHIHDTKEMVLGLRSGTGVTEVMRCVGDSPVGSIVEMMYRKDKWNFVRIRRDKSSPNNIRCMDQAEKYKALDFSVVSAYIEGLRFELYGEDDPWYNEDKDVVLAPRMQWGKKIGNHTNISHNGELMGVVIGNTIKGVGVNNNKRRGPVSARGKGTKGRGGPYLATKYEKGRRVFGVAWKEND